MAQKRSQDTRCAGVGCNRENTEMRTFQQYFEKGKPLVKLKIWLCPEHRG